MTEKILVKPAKFALRAPGVSAIVGGTVGTGFGIVGVVLGGNLTIQAMAIGIGIGVVGFGIIENTRAKKV